MNDKGHLGHPAVSSPTEDGIMTFGWAWTFGLVRVEPVDIQRATI